MKVHEIKRRDEDRDRVITKLGPASLPSSDVVREKKRGTILIMFLTLRLPTFIERSVRQHINTARPLTITGMLLTASIPSFGTL